MASKKEDKSYNISSSNDFSDNSISSIEEYLPANKSKKQDENDYVNLWKKINDDSVFQSQKHNKEMSDAIKNYVKGIAFKRVIENETKKAVDKYAKEPEFKKSVNDIVKDTEEKLRDKIDDGKLKTIETLGIFVALFTFVSVEFQVFRIFHTPESIGGLTLILLGSLIIFLAVLDFVINSTEKINKKFIPLLVISCGFIISGIYIFIKTPQEKLNIDREIGVENRGSSM